MWSFVLVPFERGACACLRDAQEDGGEEETAAREAKSGLEEEDERDNNNDAALQNQSDRQKASFRPLCR